MLKYRTIAVTGDVAPGLAPPLFLQFFSTPRIDAEGNVAFSALLGGTSVGSIFSAGIWKDFGRGLEFVTRGGEAVPGTSVAFLTIGPPQISTNQPMCSLEMRTATGWWMSTT